MKKLAALCLLLVLPGMILGQAAKKPVKRVDKAAPPAPAPVPAAPAPAPAPVAETPAPAPVAADTAAKNPSAILDTKEAEENAANQEAGAYQRKSVSFINALWLMDKSVRGMPSEYVSYTLDKAKEKLTMPRFDYNPLPDAMIADFVTKANAQEKITIENLAALMDETVVPKILQIVDLQKEMRAAGLTTEQQRNSFYSDKAKELGYTDVEIAKVMNSAFIYIPVCADYSGLSSGGQYKMIMDVGILWYRISTKGEKAQAKLVVKKMTKSLGFAKEGRKFMYDGKFVDAKEFAYRTCVKNAARNLLVATQEMPEFRLSSQVLEVDAGKVGFDLGKKEGLRIDDKYQIVEFEEGADGSVKQVASGWVTVCMVADTNSKEGYKSKARVVNGAPSQGVILSEFPRIPIDLALKFRTVPGVVDANDDDIFTSGYGVQLDARYNVGRHFNWSQLFVGLGYGLGGMGTGDKSGYDGGFFTGMDFFAVQRFYLNRFTVGGELGFSSQTLTATMDAFGITVPISYDASAFFIGGNAGFALTPTINLEASIRYETGSATLGTDFDHNGVGIHAGLVYSPPSLPFDPVDFVRGRLGI